MTGPPLLLLGVRRSGTTLLRVMLDRSSVLCVPDESYFVPQLAARHRGRSDPAAFAEDLRRVRRLPELGVTADDVAPRLRPGMTAGEMVSAVFESIAAAQGKERWGDKTPLYMQHLRTLERLFPDARYVHLIRDGRDAALSFLAVPRGIMTEGFGHPRDAAGFARMWRAEIEDARALGRRAGGRYLEVRYEQLVAEPERTLRTVCAHADVLFEEAMLEYRGTVDLSGKPHQQRLAQAPTPGVRDWRTELPDGDVRAFEEVAAPLLRDLGYEVRHGPGGAAASARLAAYRAQVAGWRLAAQAVQRSPLWRRRHRRVA